MLNAQEFRRIHSPVRSLFFQTLRPLLQNAAMQYLSLLVHVLLRRAYQTSTGPAIWTVQPTGLVASTQNKRASAKKRNAKPPAIEPGQVAKGLSHQQQTHAAGMGRMIERPKPERECLAAGVGGPGKAGSLLLRVFLGHGVASSSSGGTSSSRCAGWGRKVYVYTTCFDGESSQSD